MTEFTNAQTAKIIKGLEECSKADFNPCMDRVCPYAPKNTNNFCNCRIHLIIDALALLKEQEELVKEHEVCENCPYKLEDIGDFSDGYHTFNDLYYQRCVLFATIVNTHKNNAWKTRYHEDGEPCFGGGWFLVTVETPEGAYGYHYEDKYWNMFDCKELPKAKRWDGYTDKDVGRLLTLK